MDHEKLILMSPALLDKMLNHMSGGHEVASTTNNHIPDSDLDEKLKIKSVNEMNDALQRKPENLKQYNSALYNYRNRVFNNMAEINGVQPPTITPSQINEKSDYEIIENDDNDAINTEKNNSESEYSESDYSITPRKRPVVHTKIRALQNINKDLTATQRANTQVIKEFVKQSDNVIKVMPNGEVLIDNRLLPDVHIKDLYTAIVTNRTTKPLTLGAIPFARALVRLGMSKSLIKDERIIKEIKKIHADSSHKATSPVKWLKG